MHTLTRVHLASLPCRKYSGTVGHSCTHDSLATRPPPITDAECEQGIRGRFSGSVVGRSCESRSTEDPHRIRSREPSRSILARVSQPTNCPDPHCRRLTDRFLFLFRFGGAASRGVPPICSPTQSPPRVCQCVCAPRRCEDTRGAWVVGGMAACGGVTQLRTLPSVSVCVWCGVCVDDCRLLLRDGNRDNASGAGAAEILEENYKR
jgi:hypothetical protein